MNEAKELKELVDTCHRLREIQSTDVARVLCFMNSVLGPLEKAIDSKQKLKTADADFEDRVAFEATVVKVGWEAVNYFGWGQK